MGTSFLAATLLEEHLHKFHGFRDESRELQNWLFQRLIVMAGEVGADPAQGPLVQRYLDMDQLQPTSAYLNDEIPF